MNSIPELQKRIGREMRPSSRSLRTSMCVGVAVSLLASVAVHLFVAPSSFASSNSFIWPTSGHTDADEVAWHRANENGAKAVDIQAWAGSPVGAAQSGVVVVAHKSCADSNSWNCGNGFGNHVIIRHDRTGVANPLYTLYGHLKAASIKVNRESFVDAGAQLGVIAMSGSTYGEHVHFAIGTCASLWSSRCTIWNGPDTTSGRVVAGTAIAGTYLQLVGYSGGSSSNRAGGDFNSDGHSDIAWYQGSTLFALHGRGNGTVGVGGSTPGIGAPTWAGVGSFNGDNRSDLAWYQGTTIFTLSGQANGTFTIGGSTPGIGAPTWAGVGDFNSDGHSDIAWYQGSTLFALHGRGNGAVGVGGSTPGIGTPTWAGVGDFNGDGRSDIAWYQGTTIFTLSGQVNGTFSIGGSTPGIGAPTWAGAGDFNGDGRSDLAWYQGHSLYTLHGQANGSFTFGGSTPGIGAPTWAGVGSFNGDNRSDLAWYQGTTIFTLSGQTNGTFTIGGSTPGIGTPTRAAAGSFAGSNGS